MAHVSVDERTIAAFCRKHHIRRLALLGSARHGDSTADSDLDVLIEFEDGHVPRPDLAAMAAELSELLRQTVALNTPEFLGPYFRDQVLAEAEVDDARAG